MVTLIRLARVVLILMLAALAVSSVIGVATPETGMVEKVVLVAVFGGCVFSAAQVTNVATRLASRVQSR
jgi:4-hydroxybenzoate polyprenyltransferase